MEKIIILSGNEDTVNQTMELLKNIQYLCSIGASRNILVRVDGDGRGDLSLFNINGEYQKCNKHYSTDYIKNKDYNFSTICDIPSYD